MADITLQLFTVPVRFLNGQTATACAEGNNASWRCTCGEPLIGRCYFQFGHDCHTTCHSCGRNYRVVADPHKRADHVQEY